MLALLLKTNMIYPEILEFSKFNHLPKYLINFKIKNMTIRINYLVVTNDLQDGGQMWPMLEPAFMEDLHFSLN